MRQAAIYYQPEGYNTLSKHLMGRQAAGEGFLRAAAQSDASNLACHSLDAKTAEHFTEQLRQSGFKGQTTWIPLDDVSGLAEAGSLFLPGPNLTDFAWQRLPVGQRQYSLCGLTHTTASHLAMTAVTDLLVAPVRSWDALICTSRAVRDTVRYLLEQQSEYLRDRLGAARFELPQLPIIPLGVHCADYEFTESQQQSAREQLGVGIDEVVILYVGRLSFHAKAHPQQMMAALGRVSQGRQLRLLQCGWYANEPIENAFKEAAKLLCPSVAFQSVDGRDPEARRLAWAAGDIFMSLSDNIQETFGLTPIEAMAAGLPVIVSDWDGYKDTVRHGVDGFRISTMTPPAPLGADFAARYELGIDNYDFYCGIVSQLTALDYGELTEACETLIADKSLRDEMGAAGRRRAQQHFEWNEVYRQYQLLWGDLAERRRADPDLYPPIKPRRSPSRPDPFAAFANYPSAVLSDRDTVSLIGNLQQFQQRRQLMLNQFGTFVQPSANECEIIVAMLQEEGSARVDAIVDHFEHRLRAKVARGLVWLAKMELIQITRTRE